MFQIPDPLHPALVHFPIAFVLLGVCALFVAVIFPRVSLVWFAAVVMLLGAITAGVAEETGEDEARAVGLLQPPGGELLAEHGEWGERVVSAAWISAMLSVVAALLRGMLNYPKLESRLSPDARMKAHFAVRIFVFAALLVGVWAAFAVVQAGHYGGLMVYHEHIGMRKAPGE